MAKGNKQEKAPTMADVLGMKAGLDTPFAPLTPTADALPEGLVKTARTGRRPGTSAPQGPADPIPAVAPLRRRRAAPKQAPAATIPSWKLAGVADPSIGRVKDPETGAMVRFKMPEGRQPTADELRRVIEAARAARASGNGDQESVGLATPDKGLPTTMSMRTTPSVTGLWDKDSISREADPEEPEVHDSRTLQAIRRGLQDVKETGRASTIEARAYAYDMQHLGRPTFGNMEGLPSQYVDARERWLEAQRNALNVENNAKIDARELEEEPEAVAKRVAQKGAKDVLDQTAETIGTGRMSTSIPEENRETAGEGFGLVGDLVGQVLRHVVDYSTSGQYWKDITGQAPAKAPLGRPGAEALSTIIQTEGPGVRSDNNSELYARAFDTVLNKPVTLIRAGLGDNRSTDELGPVWSSLETLANFAAPILLMGGVTKGLQAAGAVAHTAAPGFGAVLKAIAGRESASDVMRTMASRAGTVILEQAGLNAPGAIPGMKDAGGAVPFAKSFVQSLGAVFDPNAKESARTQSALMLGIGLFGGLGALSRAGGFKGLRVKGRDWSSAVRSAVAEGKLGAGIDAGEAMAAATSLDAMGTQGAAMRDKAGGSMEPFFRALPDHVKQELDRVLRELKSSIKLSEADIEFGDLRDFFIGVAHEQTMAGNATHFGKNVLGTLDVEGINTATGEKGGTGAMPHDLAEAERLALVGEKGPNNDSFTGWRKTIRETGDLPEGREKSALAKLYRAMVKDGREGGPATLDEAIEVWRDHQDDPMAGWLARLDAERTAANKEPVAGPVVGKGVKQDLPPENPVGRAPEKSVLDSQLWEVPFADLEGRFKREDHRAAVEAAIKRGDTVPEKVRADYPELFEEVAKPVTEDGDGFKVRQTTVAMGDVPVKRWDVRREGERGRVSGSVTESPSTGVHYASVWDEGLQAYRQIGEFGSPEAAIDFVKKQLSSEPPPLPKSFNERNEGAKATEDVSENVVSRNKSEPVVTDKMPDDSAQKDIKTDEPTTEPSNKNQAQNVSQKADQSNDRQVNTVAAEPVASKPAKVKHTEQGHSYVEAEVDPKNVGVKPGMQYKRKGIDNLTDAVDTKITKGVKWIRSLGGMITIWEDKNGKQWVMNGHHRRVMALQSGTKSMLARVYKEVWDDGTPGMSFEEARGMGALHNIAEGKGTAIDAAGVIRDLGYGADKLADMGINMGSGNLGRDALSLLKLPKDLLEMVENGHVDEKVAAALAESGLPDDKLKVAMRLAQDVETPGQAYALARQIEKRKLVVTDDGSGNLFGEVETTVPVVEAAKLEEAVLKRMLSNAQLFKRMLAAKEAGSTKVDRGAQKSEADKLLIARETIGTNAAFQRSLDQEAIDYAKTPTNAQLQKAVDRLVEIAAKGTYSADRKPEGAGVPNIEGGARIGGAQEGPGKGQLSTGYGARVASDGAASQKAESSIKPYPKNADQETKAIWFMGVQKDLSKGVRSGDLRLDGSRVVASTPAGKKLLADIVASGYTGTIPDPKAISERLGRFNDAVGRLIDKGMKPGDAVKQAEQDLGALFQQEGFFDDEFTLAAPVDPRDAIRKAADATLARFNGDHAKAVIATQRVLDDFKLTKTERKHTEKVFDELMYRHLAEANKPLAKGPEVVDRGSSKAPVQESMPGMGDTKGQYSIFDDGLFQSDSRPVAEKRSDKLVSLHNTSIEGVELMLEWGGLPAPSIAILKPGMDFHGYGQVTLVMRRDAVDPALHSSNWVLESDGYTPRAPRPSFVIPMKEKSAWDSGIVGWDEQRQTGLDFALFDSNYHYSQAGGKAEFLLRAPEKAGTWYMYLKDTGKPIPKVPMKPAPLMYLTHNVSKEVFQFLSHPPDRNAKYEDVQAWAKQAFEKVYPNIEQRPGIWGRGDDSNDIPLQGADYIRDDALKITRKEMVPDVAKYKAMIKQAAFGKKEPMQNPAFAQWLKDWSDRLFTEPHVKVGGKKRAYTLDNIVDAMGRSVRGAESTMTFGHGNARAKGAKRFPTLESIRKESSRLVSEEAFEVWKEANTSNWDAAVNEMEFGKGVNTFSMLDSISAAVGRSIVGGDATPAKMRGALSREYVTQNLARPVTDETIGRLVEFANNLKHGPTEYFEAKPMRAVMIDEVAGAVVPKGTSKDLIRRLKEKGLDVREYVRNGRDDPARAEEVQKIKGALWQQAEDQRIAMLQRVGKDKRGMYLWDDTKQRGRVTLFSGSDASTVVHEFAHHLLQVMPKAEQGMIEKWAGVPAGTLSKWNGGRQWRDAHEKFAVAVEARLMSGDFSGVTNRSVRASMERVGAAIKFVYGEGGRRFGDGFDENTLHPTTRAMVDGIVLTPSRKRDLLGMVAVKNAELATVPDEELAKATIAGEIRGRFGDRLDVEIPGLDQGSGNGDRGSGPPGKKGRTNKEPSPDSAGVSDLSETMYHGGPAGLTELTLRGRGGHDAGGIFLTPSRDYALQYAKGGLYSAEVKGKKIFDARKPADLEKLKDGFLKMVDAGEYDSKESALRDYAEVIKLDLRDWATGSQYVEVMELAGFDGVRFQERPGTIGLADDGGFTVSGDPIESVALFNGPVKVKPVEGLFQGERFGDSDVVYHRAQKGAEFDELQVGKDGGIHFGTKAQAAMRGSGKEFDARLSMRRTMRSKDTGGNWAQKIRSAKSKGFDSIVYLNRYEGIPFESLKKRLEEGWTGEKLDRISDSQFKKLFPEAADSFIVFEKTQVRKPSEGLFQEDYKGEHTAPEKGEGYAPAHDLAGVYPDDFYSPEGLRYYGDGHDADLVSYSALRSLRNRPNAEVTIYRAVPAERVRNWYKEKAYGMRYGSAKFKAKYGQDYNEFLAEFDLHADKPVAKSTIKINRGDWVTLSRLYAKSHGESALNGNYRIISKKVYARDLFTDGNSIHEFGYDPQPYVARAPKANEGLFQEDRPVPGWYRQVEKVVDLMPQERMSVGQLRGWLKGKVKADEMYWSGMDDLLGGRDDVMVTREDVKWLIEGFRLRVEETLYKDFPRPGIDSETTRYHNYTLPGGKNYRELIIGVPTSVTNGVGPYKSNHWNVENPVVHMRFKDRVDAQGRKVLFIEEVQSDWHQEGREKGYKDPVALKAIWERRDEIIEKSNDVFRRLMQPLDDAAEALKAAEDGQTKRSMTASSIYRLLNDAYYAVASANTYFRNSADLSEWDVRVDMGRQKLSMALEELDAFQMALPSGLADKIRDFDAAWDTLKKSRNELLDITGDIRENQRLVRETDRMRTLVERGPFSKSWPELAMKRMMRWAAEEGYDVVAWANGDVHRERYNKAMADQADEITVVQPKADASKIDLIVRKDGKTVFAEAISPDKLSDYVGAKMAADFREEAGKHDFEAAKVADEAEPNAWGAPKGAFRKTFAGEGLDVGGHGYRKFYDEILPKLARDLMKKYGGGAEVGKVAIPLSESGRVAEGGLQGWNDGAGGDKPKPAQVADFPGFEVTPELRRTVLEEGLPLFQGENDPVYDADLSALVRAGYVVMSDRPMSKREFAAAMKVALGADSKAWAVADQRMDALYDSVERLVTNNPMLNMKRKGLLAENYAQTMADYRGRKIRMKPVEAVKWFFMDTKSRADWVSRQMESAMGAKKGAFDGTEMDMNWAIDRIKRASGRASQIVEVGWTNKDGKVVQQGLKPMMEAMASSGVHPETFAAYRTARRELALERIGRLEFDSPQDHEWRQAVVDEFESIHGEKIVKLNDEVDAFARKVLETYEDYGLRPPGWAKRIEEDSPDYWPLVKEKTPEEKGAMEESGVGGLPEADMKRVGRVGAYADGWDVMARRLERLEHAKAVSDALLPLVDEAVKNPLLSHIVKRLKFVAPEDLKSWSPVINDDPFASPVEAASASFLDDLLNGFLEKTTKEGLPLVPVARDGRIEYYQVDPLLWAAIRGTMPNQISGLMKKAFKVMAIPSKIFRTFTTGRGNPLFGVLFNPAIDVMSATVGHGYNASWWPRGLMSAMTEGKGTTSKSRRVREWSQLYNRAVADGAFFMDGVNRDFQSSEWKMIGEGAGKLEVMRKRIERHPIISRAKGSAFGRGLDFVIRIPDAIEKATRISMYEQRLKSYEKQGKSPEFARMRAAQDAIELINFGETGALAKGLTTVGVPYASIPGQVTRSMIKGFKKSPAKFMARAILMLTLPALFEQWAHGDDPEYLDLPDYVKDGMLLWKTGPGQFRGVRIPTELGVFFKGVPRRILEGMRADDDLKTIGSGIMAAIGKQFMPPVMPTWASAIAQEGIFQNSGAVVDLSFQRPLTMGGTDAPDADRVRKQQRLQIGTTMGATGRTAYDFASLAMGRSKKGPDLMQRFAPRPDWPSYRLSGTARAYLTSLGVSVGDASRGAIEGVKESDDDFRARVALESQLINDFIRKDAIPGKLDAATVKGAIEEIKREVTGGAKADDWNPPKTTGEAIGRKRKRGVSMADVLMAR